MDMVASRRLQRIVDTVAPHQQISSRVVPVPCARMSIAELEGEAIARTYSAKVALFAVSNRGVALGERPMVEDILKRRGLQPVWVDSLEEMPSDIDIIVTTGAPVDAEVLAKAPKLRLVAVAFTGVDHVDVIECRIRGVTVVNVPGYSTDATAELTMGLILSQLRRLPQCFQGVRDGSWKAPPQEDLQAKTVGIVGTGKIGLRLSELLRAFKAKALMGYDTRRKPEFSALGGVYAESLAGMFVDADIIIVCLPLTSQTQGLISEKLMELLRPECILINIARGGVMDEDALARLLKQGRFRAALDVVNNEPLPAEDPLRSVPEEFLAMTPHIGYQSSSSLNLRLDVTVKNILAFLAGQPINMV